MHLICLFILFLTTAFPIFLLTEIPKWYLISFVLSIYIIYGLVLYDFFSADDGSIDGQYDFSDVLLVQHDLLGGGRLPQRVGGVDDGADLAGFDERPDLFAQLAEHPCLHRRRAAAERAADEAEVLAP